MLTIISSQLSECRLEGDSVSLDFSVGKMVYSNYFQSFNPDSLIAQFSFEKEEERILNIFKLTDIAVIKDKRCIISKKDTDKIVLPRSINDLNIDKIKIDTCIIVTNKAIYRVLIR